MPNQIKINFSINYQNYWILIQCLDSPVVNRWYDSIKQLYADKSSMTIYKSNSIWENNPAHIKRLYDGILSAIETLKSLGIEWPIEEPPEFNYTAEWCNRLHRYFTTMTLTGNRLDLKSSQKYSICDDKMELYTTSLHTINDSVHFLEMYCSTPQKEKFLSKLKYLTIQPLNFKNKDYYKSYQFEKFNKEDFSHHTWEHYDVVFDEEILGKHILRSFLDDDNPKNIDTTGFSGWYGSFRIYWDKGKQEIYESNEFDDWLSKHSANRNHLRADFPIGNIISSSHNINDMLLDVKKTPYNRMTYIEFIN